MTKDNPKLRLRLGYSIITEMIEQGAKVLDLGCGNGNLLAKLVKEKDVKGLGVEINQDAAINAMEKGLSVIQGDIDEGLGFINQDYDWVILNQTLQSTEKPEFVVEEMLKIGKKVVVSFPNFGYWKVRFQLLFSGNTPKSKVLPYDWYNTPNIHFLTAKDFKEFCAKRGINVLKSIYITNAKVQPSWLMKKIYNLFAEEVIVVISK